VPRTARVHPDALARCIDSTRSDEPRASIAASSSSLTFPSALYFAVRWIILISETASECVCVCVCVCVMTTQTALYAERSDCCVKWQPTRRAVNISARRSRPFDSCHLWPLLAIFPSSSMRTLGYRSLITSRFNFKHSLLLFSLLFFSFNDLDATFVVHSIAFCAERYKRSCIKDRNDSIR